MSRVCSSLEQRIDNIIVSEKGRHHKRRLSGAVSIIRVGPCFQKFLRYCEMTLEGHTHQRAIPRCLVRAVRTCSQFDQQFGRVFMTVITCKDQRGVAAGILPFDVGASLDERWNYI